MAVSLQSLRGLRTAPLLEPEELSGLRGELITRMGDCEWFTVGVMAPTARRAVATLRALEQACGWEALEPDPAQEDLDSRDGPVFLKANQSTGRFRLRLESGLGEGVLITGHSATAPEAEDTWGPLPLQCFG
ncbi:conserved hypothetical protein [Cyanobium sp. PCC 7001]|uniref:DUF1824 family protein n=1 Tax=Cyanobium sp. PCC 7001 TaxID=180281 RepID=UPI000180503F|nr:DUF1824 family protein [Cyanobium sp. PCC 7001]EDY38827.1 conserved hypothetical protein [Cyanobium sp. PCC 7001]